MWDLPPSDEFSRLVLLNFESIGVIICSTPPFTILKKFDLVRAFIHCVAVFPLLYCLLHYQQLHTYLIRANRKVNDDLCRTFLITGTGRRPFLTHNSQKRNKRPLSVADTMYDILWQRSYTNHYCWPMVSSMAAVHVQDNASLKSISRTSKMCSSVWRQLGSFLKPHHEHIQHHWRRGLSICRIQHNWNSPPCVSSRPYYRSQGWVLDLQQSLFHCA